MRTVTPPSNIGTGLAIGQFVEALVDGSDPGVEPDFASLVGTIDFTSPVAKFLDATATPNPVTVVPSKVTAILNADGYLCTPQPDDPSVAGTVGLRLVATDDPDLNPVDWTWTVTYNLRTQRGERLTLKSHSLSLPQGTTVDLTLVEPVESSPGNAIIAGPKGDKGDQGNQGIQGIQGLQGDQGDKGDTGDTGDTGVRGSKWFTGHGAPGSIGGSLPGDEYLDLDTGDIYELS